MIAWPSSIPLPFVEFAGQSRHSTIASPFSQGRIDRRSRYSMPYGSMVVRWVLDPAQWTAFRTFFETTLGNGISLFTIELRHPKHSELVEWVVRFVGSYQSRNLEGLWAVDAELDLIRRSELAPIAIVEDWGPFMVAPEESSEGDHHEFTVVGDHPYYVRRE